MSPQRLAPEECEDCGGTGVLVVRERTEYPDAAESYVACHCGGA